MCIILGSKKQKREASEELEKNPLKCGDFITKEKEVEKWLGQYMSAAGLADSVAKTVEAREGKIKGACLEIATTVNDWRSSVVGGLETALLLWETCCIPSLLHGAGTWTEMSRDTERRLNSLQQWFLRLVLQVGPGAPLPSLLWDFHCLDMGLQVDREKLMLALHCRRLGEDALAGQVYSEQQAQGWPGLAMEAREICEKLKIESCDTTSLSSGQYRKYVTQACHEANEERLREKSVGKQKCEKILEEDYENKSYIGEERIENVRNIYRTRFGLMPFAANYSHSRKFEKTHFMCRCEQAREDERHVTSRDCPVYADIREQFLELDDDKKVMEYFVMVLARRDELDSLKEKE